MSENNTPVPGSPEHDAAMIALAERSGVTIKVSDTEGNTTDVTGTPAATPAEEPALILGKFKSQADLEAAYKELESKLGKPKPVVADPLKPAAPAAPTQPSGEPAQTPALDALVLQATNEYAESGTFTDATFAALEQAGIPRAMADNYVAGLKAQQELVETRVYGEAGGKDQYAVMQEWAASNMTESQLAAYNAAVTSGDMTATLGAIANLKAIYTAANGSDPSTRVERQGGSGNEPVADMYTSKVDVMKDMNDPRYRAGDRAFHAIVDRKLAASMKAGIDLGF